MIILNIALTEYWTVLKPLEIDQCSQNLATAYVMHLSHGNSMETAGGVQDSHDYTQYCINEYWIVLKPFEIDHILLQDGYCDGSNFIVAFKFFPLPCLCQQVLTT